MTHEFKKIIETYALVSKLNVRAVLATVVCVEGSSYRREGVRMLVLDNNQTIGAISGGCVEKEVVKQAASVFLNEKAKIMTYDGRYRLGCEGMLYVLLEVFEPKIATLKIIQNCIRLRIPFLIHSYYHKENFTENKIGSHIEMSDKSKFSLSSEKVHVEESNLSCFTEKMVPLFKLVLIGAEHDAEKLCEIASLLGWEVVIIGSENSYKTRTHFPNASEVIRTSPENLEIKNIDIQTAVVLMTHNFAKDVLYLKALKEAKPCYIGLLGPAKRREKLLDSLIEYHPEVEETFLNTIHGPAGLNIGAETPEEIAISIIAEITSVIRNQKVIPLQEKAGGIHSDRSTIISKSSYEI